MQLSIPPRFNLKNNNNNKYNCLPCVDGVICVSNDGVVSVARISTNFNRNRRIVINERHFDRAMHTLEIILLTCGLAHFVCVLRLK